MTKKINIFALIIPIAALIFFILTPVFASAAPVILYTDILSGPNTGGENNNGAYLSIFGKGFGTTRGTSKVTINGVEVATYKQWGAPSKVYDSHGIQVITVQPGSGVTTGAIKIVVNGESSNTDKTFTVGSGDIYFVDNVVGNDSTGVIGDITKPFRYVNSVFYRSDFGPGDTIVMRGKGVPWTDVNSDGIFLLIQNKTGTAAGPLTITGYPGESVDVPGNKNTIIKFSQVSTINCSYLTVANINIINPEYSGYGGIEFMGTGSQPTNNSIINVEISGAVAGKMGAISESGNNARIYGNYLHHNGNTTLDYTNSHGIYFPGDHNLQSDNVEIAWNYIHDQKGGKGIQSYHGNAPSGFTNFFTNWQIHDNILYNIAHQALTIGEYSGVNYRIYNNIIYESGLAGGGCALFQSGDVEAIIYNNVFYNCPSEGAFYFKSIGTADIKNNIIQVSSNQYYYSKELGVLDSQITASSNIWYGSSQSAPSWGTSPIINNPLFVDSTSPARNFHLQANSPAIDTGATVSVSRDFDGVTRPQGIAFDIGAFEYNQNTSSSDTTPPAAPTGLTVN